MDQKEIDKAYLRLAYRFAELSPDPSTQNGSIIVRDNSSFSMDTSNLISFGFNGFPIGVEPKPERLERPLKYSFVDHGETSGISSANRKLISLKGAIMYAPWFACDKCGIATVQSGLKEVIGSTWPEIWWKETRKNNEDNKKDWYEGIRCALEMFDEKGVKYRWVDGKIGGVEILFDGVRRKP